MCACVRVCVYVCVFVYVCVCQCVSHAPCMNSCIKQGNKQSNTFKRLGTSNQHVAAPQNRSPAISQISKGTTAWLSSIILSAQGAFRGGLITFMWRPPHLSHLSSCLRPQPKFNRPNMFCSNKQGSHATCFVCAALYLRKMNDACGEPICCNYITQVTTVKRSDMVLGRA